jgi:hypothetical protein
VLLVRIQSGRVCVAYNSAPSGVLTQKEEEEESEE